MALVRGSRRLVTAVAVALIFLTIYYIYTPSVPSVIGGHVPLKNPPSTPGKTTSKPADPVFNEDNRAPGLPPNIAPGLNPPESQNPTPPAPGTSPDKPDLGTLPVANPGHHPDPPKDDLVATSSSAAAAPGAKETEFVRVKKGYGLKKGVPTEHVLSTHRELSSLTTSDGTYFDVDFSPWPAYNPNFTPHPKKNDTWIAVAQFHKVPGDNQAWFTQIICEAKFIGNSLKCTHPPWTVPIPPTWTDQCKGDIAHFNFNIGPHDARVFYGPEYPYILYGTQASYSCFGQYFQDFTLVSDWPMAVPREYYKPTEISRPPPHKYGKVEKNWFLFWDYEGEIYVHHDIAPARVFGKMDAKGNVARDANEDIAVHEEQCLKKLLPYAKDSYEESIHQATNSLAITMCNRADPTCVRTPQNTKVVAIHHWKSFYEFHGLYEPFVHVFDQAAPFKTYGVTTKPLWFRGRRLPKEWRVEGEHGWNQTEMIYTTSLAWKDHGMKYHGYLDDTMLIGFGIEDAECGGLDIKAGELLRDLALCDGSMPPKIDV